MQSDEAKENEFHALTEQTNTLRGQIHELSRERANLEQTLSVRQAEFAALGSTNQSLAQSRAALLQTEMELAEARSELKKLAHVREDLRTFGESLQLSVSRREDEDSKASQLTAENVSAQKLLDDIHEVIGVLQSQQTEQEALAQKLADQTAEYQIRHDKALAETEAGEQALSDLQINVRTREGMLIAQIEELTGRVDGLRREEDGLSASLQASRERLHKNDAAYQELEKKLSDKELAYSQFTHSGDKLVSLSEALSYMETREHEVSRHLTEVAEQELSTQVKLSSLDEEIAREHHRLEQVRHLREHEEQEHRTAIENSTKELDAARRQLADQLKREESALSLRLKARIQELEEKHETLRLNLSSSMEEKTVIVFAGDLIKRIDLVDILIQRSSGSVSNAGLEQQLRTLRTSFEDILTQHGIREFTVANGTEVDVDLRLRITIVESIAGPECPKVVECYRPGFIYAGENGREVILRKVEVKTTSA